VRKGIRHSRSLVTKAVEENKHRAHGQAREMENSEWGGYKVDREVGNQDLRYIDG
jgi:hypothetical protein